LLVLAFKARAPIRLLRYYVDYAWYVRKYPAARRIATVLRCTTLAQLLTPETRCELHMPGLYFEEFSVGQTFDHPIRRTITEADNVLLTTMTHNPAALHLDAEYMKNTPYGKPIVNSCLTLSLMVGISVNETTHMTTVANLGWDEVRFPKPLFCGDTIHIQTEVLELRDSKSRPDNGIVVFMHRAFNQGDELVGECKRSALMLRKPK